MLDEILMHIRDQSRIIACGAISSYNQKNPYRIKNYSRIIIKRALIQGFIYFDYAKEFPKAIMHLAKMMADGKLKYSIDLRKGLD
jgi:NADPH-dependent curcumin reductase CurA